MKAKPEHEVLIPIPGEFVNVPGYGAQPKYDKGLITTHRLRLNYELGFVIDAVANLKRWSVATLPHNIEVLEAKIDMLRIGINEVLNEKGDTDPRHDSGT